MNRRTHVSVLLVIVLTVAVVCVPAWAVAQEKPAAKTEQKESGPPKTKDGKKLLTAQDTLRIASVGGPRISPDGTRVAYTVSEIPKFDKDKEWKSATQVWVAPVAGGTARQFTRGEKNASAPEWSPDGKYLAFLTDREKEGERQVWMAWADGGEAWEVTSHEGGVSGFRFSPDGKLLLSATDQASKEEEEKIKVRDDTIEIDRNLRMTHLWLWDIEKKEEKRLTEGEFTTSDARWSPDGVRISYVTNPTPKADDGDLTDIWILTVATGEKKKLVENAGPDQSARWSPDGKWIAYTTADAAGGVKQSHLNVISADGGTPRRLTTNFELDASTPLWSRDGKTIYFSSNTQEAVEVFSCEVASGTVKQLTQNGSIVSLSELSSDGKTAVGTMAQAKWPAEVFRSDIGFKSLERVTDLNPWLKEYALGDVEVVKWKSTDGTEIEGVLTKPVGYEAGRKYPLLVNPHGGPTGASLASFSASVQVLAANGYLVLQPNFRGSTGRGEKFAAANKNTWGKGDYEDCMTGVDFALKQGWADADRLGAYGWSYGGYMTFWMLTQTDRFKAVSPGAGLTNMYSMYSQNDIQRYLRWFFGDGSPWDNTDLYWDRSPMKYVKNVKTPAMILHGQQDTRVPIAQAQEFYRALVERNVPVEFVVFPREGHGISEPRHQMDRIRRYLTFFGKYLSNPVVTEPAAPKAKAKDAEK
ncbi:MAG: S9 family peptidase [Acidobacteria bacterium]|nr:S9 family peptidase [Acidobacteriota bacterium]